MFFNLYIILSLLTFITNGCVPLLIDDYSQQKNLIKGRRGDRGTMNNFEIGVATLTVNPKNEFSYFFETGLCESRNFNALFSEWQGIEFTLNPGDVIDLDFEITLTTGNAMGCNQPERYISIALSSLGTPLIPNAINIIRIPFSHLTEANLANLYAISFEKFTKFGNDIQFGPISLFCNQGSVCGPQVNLFCGPNECCSSDGVCGMDFQSCSVVLGCQRDFGRCSKPMYNYPNVPIINPAFMSKIYTECVKPGLFALTFDDGPSNNFPILLDILKQHQVPATFFVNGYGRSDISVSPGIDWLFRAYLEGHLIASHSFDHLNMIQLNTKEQYLQMKWNDDVIFSVIRKRPLYMRPPYSAGVYNESFQVNMGSFGYKIIHTNFVTSDTNDAGDVTFKGNDFNTYVNTLESTFPDKSSFISIQHDYVDDTVQSLIPKVIEYVKQKGYKFVTVGECLGDVKVYN